MGRNHFGNDQSYLEKHEVHETIAAAVKELLIVQPPNGVRNLGEMLIKMADQIEAAKARAAAEATAAVEAEEKAKREDEALKPPPGTTRKSVVKLDPSRKDTVLQKMVHKEF